MNNTFDVVITAGGTKEQIDDVRYIGNFATGELGINLARAYEQQGFRVLVLAPESVISRFGLPKGVEFREFTSAESLQVELLSVSEVGLVLHSAAVSDYTPIRAKGKISSDKDELVLTLKRTPKILPQLRTRFGTDTIIIGFKLLSGVPETKLIKVAKAQISTAQTDFCIANLLEHTGQRRQIHIVSKDGSVESVEGDVATVAKKIASNEAILSGLRE